MLVEHQLVMYCTCPVNKMKDIYTLIIRTDRIIKVEDIKEAVAEVSKEPTFQEDLTQRLSEILACEVETNGLHQKVRTMVICGRKPA
jgi:GTP cyclohydrolase I